MYFVGSVVGKASIIRIDISPTPLLIFTGWGSKSAKFGAFKTSHNFEPLAFENAARYLNAETNFLCRSDRSLYALTEFGEVGSTHPVEPFVIRATSWKLHGENVLNRQ